jgi:ABC-2 type transport system ATP-binding protein
MPASSGSVEIDGYNANRDANNIKKLIGVVPQEIALYDELTAYENLRFWGKINNVGTATLKQRIGEVLNFLDCTIKETKELVLTVVE